MTLRRLFDGARAAFWTSRPHLLAYTFGWLYLGSALASTDPSFVFRPMMLPLTVGSFLALFFVHALNDAFDLATDAANPRKHEYEQVAYAEQHAGLMYASGAALVLLLIIALWYPITIQALVVLWALLVITYNVPPLRLKRVPFLDLLFPVNFMLWGVMGYTLAAGSWPPVLLLGAAVIFVGLMHVYSAVIDITYDAAAGIRTTAVALGATVSLGVCVLGAAGLAVGALVAGYAVCALALALYALFFAVYTVCAARRPQPSDVWYLRFVMLHYLCGALVWYSLI